MTYSREYLARYENKEPNHVPIFEVLYTYRKLVSGAVVLAKFVDGSTSPVETYQIVNSRCDCFGASRGRECKHIAIRDSFEDLPRTQGLKISGSFYDYDRKTFYVPADGEGIPLQGIVDLVQLVS